MTTVAENPRRNERVISGSAVVPYDFPILDENDIEVIQNGTTLVFPQYSVTGVGNSAGGTVILATAPADGTVIVLLGRQPREQQSVYTVEAFPPERIQNDFNKVWMAMQQAYEILNRTPALAKHSLIDAPIIPDPTAIDQFLRVTNVSPFTVGWGTLAALAGAVGIPLALSNGGTGSSFASVDALAKGLNLARWASMTISPSAGVLTLPNPITGNRISVGGGAISGITTSGVATGTLLLLDYTTGSNALTDSANFQLQGRAAYTTILNDRSLFYFDGTSWLEIERFPVLVSANATKVRFGDGTWKSLASQFNPAGIISGLRVSNSVGDITNDLDIAVGDAFSDNVDPQLRVSMRTSSVFTKQLDATWAAGSNAGGRVAGQALADGTWHLIMFKRSGGAIDFCFTDNLTFTLPDSGTDKLRIWSFRRVGGAIKRFTQLGGRSAVWFEPILDFNSNVGTARQLQAMLVPTGIRVRVTMDVFAAAATGNVRIMCPDVDDDQISTNPGANEQLPNVGINAGTYSAQVQAITDLSGQVAMRATSSVAIRVSALGWTDLDLLTMQG